MASPNNHSPPTLLTLPLEIRQQIYTYLLITRTTSPKDHSKFLVSHPDYHEITNLTPTSTPEPSFPTLSNAPSSSTNPPTDASRTLHIRNTSHLTHPSIQNRTTYKIRADRFRARCVSSTYTCINAGTPFSRIHASILAACHQTHAEAAPLLYAHYTFAFDTHVEAAAPFFSDLTARSRSAVRRIEVVKRALPYDKDFDRCEWRSMCLYLARALTGLRELRLGIVAGLPRLGWDGVRAFEKGEWRCVVSRFEEMSWVGDLDGFSAAAAAAATAVEGGEGREGARLQRLDVRACVEHCPEPTSAGMEFFVAFSKSIEGSFREYLSERLLQPEKGRVVECAA